MHPRAGQLPVADDLIDVDALIGAYYDLTPDVDNPDQAVAFGTSGHRGSAFDTAFNETHIVAVTQAIVEYRAAQGTTGPLIIGKDPHALSDPAYRTALTVLAAANVDVVIDADSNYMPTPAISHAILSHNRPGADHTADGIVITPSHNPPRDGGFKYNPPHGGPADTDATGWIADRANDLIRQGISQIKRISETDALAAVRREAFLTNYVRDLPSVIDVDAIKAAGVRIGADPLGGASVDYWGRIAEEFGLDLTVVDTTVDPRWPNLPLDHDGKIRMDCSSPSAMNALVAGRDRFDISTGNDADADRHGIVTADFGLMNPNHYLAVAIDYLFSRREWGDDVAVGKTLVSSSMIDRVVACLRRPLLEVPVGFKWFVPGLLDGSIGFGGEESAGASLLRRDGTTWTTDKDGIIMALLSSEITAVTGSTPSQQYAELVAKHGEPAYARADAPASREDKAALKALSPADVTATTVAGEPITAAMTDAPGNGAPIGGLKVKTENAWFAARPSGTEDLYKIYAESFHGAEHLAQVQAEAKDLVSSVLVSSKS